MPPKWLSECCTGPISCPMISALASYQPTELCEARGAPQKDGLHPRFALFPLQSHLLKFQAWQENPDWPLIKQQRLSNLENRAVGSPAQAEFQSSCPLLHHRYQCRPSTRTCWTRRSAVFTSNVHFPAIHDGSQDVPYFLCVYFRIQIPVESFTPLPLLMIHPQNQWNRIF